MAGREEKNNNGSEAGVGKGAERLGSKGSTDNERL